MFCFFSSVCHLTARRPREDLPAVHQTGVAGGQSDLPAPYLHPAIDTAQAESVDLAQTVAPHLTNFVVAIATVYRWLS